MMCNPNVSSICDQYLDTKKWTEKNTRDFNEFINIPGKKHAPTAYLSRVEMVILTLSDSIPVTILNCLGDQNSLEHVQQTAELVSSRIWDIWFTAAYS